MTYYMYADETLQDDRGILLENKKLLASKLNENMLSKNIPQILAVTKEFQSVGATS